MRDPLPKHKQPRRQQQQQQQQPPASSSDVRLAERGVLPAFPSSIRASRTNGLVSHMRSNRRLADSDGDNTNASVEGRSLQELIDATPSWSAKSLRLLVTAARQSPACETFAPPDTHHTYGDASKHQAANSVDSHHASGSGHDACISSDWRDYVLPPDCQADNASTGSHPKSRGRRASFAPAALSPLHNGRKTLSQSPSMMSMSSLHPAPTASISNMMRPSAFPSTLIAPSASFTRSRIDLKAPVKMSSLGIKRDTPEYLDRIAKLHKIKQYAQQVRQAMRSHTATSASYGSLAGLPDTNDNSQRQSAETAWELPQVAESSAVVQTQQGHDRLVSPSTSRPTSAVSSVASDRPHKPAARAPNAVPQAAKKGQDKREKMKQYAARVPKPRIALLPPLPNTTVSSKSNSASSSASSSAVRYPPIAANHAHRTATSMQAELQLPPSFESTELPDTRTEAEQELEDTRHRYYQDLVAFAKIKRELGMA